MSHIKGILLFLSHLHWNIVDAIEYSPCMNAILNLHLYHATITSFDMGTTLNDLASLEQVAAPTKDVFSISRCGNFLLVKQKIHVKVNGKTFLLFLSCNEPLPVPIT